MSKRSSKFSLKQAFELLSFTGELKSKATLKQCLRVVVDKTADPALIHSARQLFMPETCSMQLEVLPLGTEPTTPADASIFLCGTSSEALILQLSHELKHSPCLLIADEAFVPALPPELDDYVEILSYIDLKFIGERLPSVLLDTIDEKNYGPFAAAFPWLRKAVCRKLYQAQLVSNSAVAAIEFVPQADFPVLTLSQMKLALDIAAAHNKELSFKRSPELAFILLMALVYRGGAKSLCKRFPSFASAIKVAYATAGTMFDAELLLRYHELSDADIERFFTEKILPFVKKVSEKLLEFGQALRETGESEGEKKALKEPEILPYYQLYESK